MNRVFLCATLLLAVAPTTSAQDCAQYGTKKKCVQRGCEFKRVNNDAKFKTCVNPAGPAAEAAPPSSSVCSDTTSARKCKTNAACVWARQAGKKRKSCVAYTAPTAPTAAPPTEPNVTAAPPQPEYTWRKLGGCCREDSKKDLASSSVDFFESVQASKADEMCRDQCSADAACKAYELAQKKSNRFRCEMHNANVNAASRRTKSCRKAQCHIKGDLACPIVPGGACTDCLDKDTCTVVVCEANVFDTNANASDGCEAGCGVPDNAVSCQTCDTASPSGCTKLFGGCKVNFFDTNAEAHDGCEATCPDVSNGTCDTCSSASECTAVKCDTNYFNDDSDFNNGCEKTCPDVSNGTCDTCSSASECTAITCDANYFDLNGNATDGCEQGCPDLNDGTCTACSDFETCTAGACDVQFFFDGGVCCT